MPIKLTTGKSVTEAAAALKAAVEANHFGVMHVHNLKEYGGGFCHEQFDPPAESTRFGAKDYESDEVPTFLRLIFLAYLN